MYLEPAAYLGLKDSRENVRRNEERKDSKYPAVGIEYIATHSRASDFQNTQLQAMEQGVGNTTIQDTCAV